jgi:hypothetical protein
MVDISSFMCNVFSIHLSLSLSLFWFFFCRDIWHLDRDCVKQRRLNQLNVVNLYKQAIHACFSAQRT